MKKINLYGMLFATGLVLSACGGTGVGDRSDTTTKYSPAVNFTALKVFGDSLADSGVYMNLSDAGFGRVFSVNGDATKIWTEQIAAKYGLTIPCNAYTTANGSTYSAVSGCTSYAVGGARIVNSNTTSPAGINKQMADAAAIGFSDTDLVLVDGGGNDYADLISKFVAVATTSGATKQAAVGAYVAHTGASFDAVAFANATPSQQTSILVGMGITNMTKVAEAYFDMVKTNIVDKGATHVIMLNVPSVVDTPRIQEVFALVTAGVKAQATAAGASAEVAAATAKATTDQLDSVFRIWGSTFNTSLSSKVTNEGGGKVALVDIYTTMANMIAYPAKFGLTNVKDTVCPSVGVKDNLKTYNFATCTDTELSAQIPPTGATGGANWWKTYLYSDSFHPTPYGHSLMASTVLTQISAVGW